MAKASRKKQKNSPSSKSNAKASGGWKAKKGKASSTTKNAKKQPNDQDAHSHGSASHSSSSSPCDYSSRDYWEKRYEGEDVGLEWYCSLEHIRPLIERFVPKDSRILEVGCGNRPLCWELRDAGYSGHIISSDFSTSVIKKILSDNKSRDGKHGGKDIEFKVMDARNLPLEADSVDLVIDKGTVDSMLCGPSGKENARALCREAARVTSMGGWFVVVSHVHPSSEESMGFLSETFAAGLEESVLNGEATWAVDVHCCEAGVDEEKDSKDEEGQEMLDSPSVYVAHKVARRHTRSRAVGTGEMGSSKLYQMLDSFLHYIRNNSGGSVIDCKWSTKGRFMRCFMMLGGAAHFASQGVQKVFSVDATPLKGDWNGVMLTLSFKDSNSNIFLVATAICPKDDKKSYMYLLQNAKKFEPLGAVLNSYTTTCFSGGHKGSCTSLPAACPLTEDRRCLEYILKNIPAVEESGKMLCYAMSKAPTERLFLKKMDELKDSKPASAKALDKMPHRLWADYAGRGNRTWNQSTSNISEPANSMLGAKSRAKHILPLLMDILMQTASRLDGAANRKGQDRDLVPFAQVTYNEEFKRASEYQVQCYGGGLYVVAEKGQELHGNKVLFDPARIDDVSCTCGFRKRWGIPCRHMIAVAKYLPGNNNWTLDIIHEGFRLGCYRGAAADPHYRIIPPIWEDLSSNTNHVPPKWVGGKAGRPKGKCAGI